MLTESFELEIGAERQTVKLLGDATRFHRFSLPGWRWPPSVQPPHPPALFARPRSERHRPLQARFQALRESRGPRPARAAGFPSRLSRGAASHHRLVCPVRDLPGLALSTGVRWLTPADGSAGQSSRPSGAPDSHPAEGESTRHASSRHVRRSDLPFPESRCQICSRFHLLSTLIGRQPMSFHEMRTLGPQKDSNGISEGARETRGPTSV